ncbi:MAG: hypothetical protein P8P56_12295, partial [Yoonia sp.]|nr:hypothetical protein [Yoonia sp.]
MVVQDTSGNLYLVPETTYNADQAALDVKPIQSLTLDGVNFNKTHASVVGHSTFMIVLALAVQLRLQ